MIHETFFYSIVPFRGNGHDSQNMFVPNAWVFSVDGEVANLCTFDFLTSHVTNQLKCEPTYDQELYEPHEAGLMYCYVQGFCNEYDDYQFDTS